MHLSIEKKYIIMFIFLLYEFRFDLLNKQLQLNEIKTYIASSQGFSYK